MSGQLSFAVMLGVLVGSGCSHGPAVAASGWHQTAHSSEASGPATSVNTIERTAARNTSMLTHHRARHGPAWAKPTGADSQRFDARCIWRRDRLRDFADKMAKIPHPLKPECPPAPACDT